MSHPETAKAEDGKPKSHELIWSCPFCGHMDKNRIFQASHKEVWVFCGGCYATGPVAETDQLAIRRWNTRRK